MLLLMPPCVWEHDRVVVTCILGAKLLLLMPPAVESQSFSQYLRRGCGRARGLCGALQPNCASFLVAPAATTRVMVLKLEPTLAAPSSAPRHRVMRRAAPPRVLLAGMD